MLQVATQKGWKNFIFSLGLWNAGILLFSLVNPAQVPIRDWLIFYSKYSWPNFFLVYFLAIWIIPESMHLKSMLRLVSLSAFALMLFIIIRYLNNSFWDPDYYTSFDQNETPYKLSTGQILVTELWKGFQFGIIGFAYRLGLDSLILERKNNELEKAKLKAELNTLRYQLNPHFLFNSINNIYYLSISESNRTPEALIKLSDILRYLLDTKEEWVYLKNELMHLNNLISFEKIRYPEEVINFEVNIPSEYNYIKIPPLILSTFIENAFKHGKQGTYENPVEIKLELNSGKLIYQVTNPVDTSKSKDSSRKGTGLDTLAKRLELIYPAKHVFSFGNKDSKFIALMELNFET